MDFFQKKFLIFFEKIIKFSKNAKGSNFAVECDWISKIAQKVEKLDPFWNKDLFFEEKSWFF